MLVLALCMVIYSISCGFVVQQAVGLQQNPQKSIHLIEGCTTSPEQIYTTNVQQIEQLYNKSTTFLKILQLVVQQHRTNWTSGGLYCLSPSWFMRMRYHLIL